MDRTVAILRWAAVLPVFLITAVIVGSLIIFGLYAVALLAIVKWFLPDAQQYLAFWRGGDMGGNFLDGTAWIFITYAIAFSAAINLAARVAPSRPIQTAWVLTSVALLVLLLSFVLTVVPQGDHTFSFWYRSLVEAFSIAAGCGFGIWQARSDAHVS